MGGGPILITSWMLTSTCYIEGHIVHYIMSKSKCSLFPSFDTNFHLSFHFSNWIIVFNLVASKDGWIKSYFTCFVYVFVRDNFSFLNEKYNQKVMNLNCENNNNP